MTNAEAIAILKTYDVNFYNDDGHKIRADKICEALDVAIKALEQEPSVSENPNNCEMRDATLEERESIDKYIKSISKPTGVKFGALEQEPSGDCISRQAVLNTEYQVKIINDIEYVMLSEVQMKMRKLPSVKPQESTGHWIIMGDRYIKCSECGHITKTESPDIYHFCMVCGANMSENPTGSESEEV